MLQVKFWRTWLPHPYLSILLAMTWLALAKQWSWSQGLLAVFWALLIPRLSAPFWPERPRQCRLGLLAIYLNRLLLDILLANLSVAWQIIQPRLRLQPALIYVPLSITDPFVATVLANVISLTPGTVTADLCLTKRYILVHVLTANEPQTLITTLKQRYEQPLQDIFGLC
jgi:multicomponent K+:H+ antiporter subunit E